MQKLSSNFSGLLGRMRGIRSRISAPITHRFRQINDRLAQRRATSLTLCIEGLGEQKWL